MSVMRLEKKYELNIQGIVIRDVSIVDEWNGFIELDAGPNKGMIIIRRKDWNNGKRWEMEKNAFTNQWIDVVLADERIGLPKTKITFGFESAKDDHKEIV